MVLDKHSTIKSQKIRGNREPFMSKELSEGIMNKSNLRNSYVNSPPRGNLLAFKKQKSFCNNLSKKIK